MVSGVHEGACDYIRKYRIIAQIRHMRSVLTSNYGMTSHLTGSSTGDGGEGGEDGDDGGEDGEDGNSMESSSALIRCTPRSRQNGGPYLPGLWMRVDSRTKVNDAAKQLNRRYCSSGCRHLEFEVLYCPCQAFGLRSHTLPQTHC